MSWSDVGSGWGGKRHMRGRRRALKAPRTPLARAARKAGTETLERQSWWRLLTGTDGRRAREEFRGVRKRPTALSPERAAEIAWKLASTGSWVPAEILAAATPDDVTGVITATSPLTPEQRARVVALLRGDSRSASRGLVEPEEAGRRLEDAGWPRPRSAVRDMRGESWGRRTWEDLRAW